MTTAEEVIRHFRLEPHQIEGGHYRETYRSAGPAAAGPGERSLSTAIYYLLDAGSKSRMHRLPGDEIFHFYAGDPVEMLHLYPDGRVETVVLGNRWAEGDEPQVVVPGGVWQGARLIDGGAFALLGTTMAPGFDYADYEVGDRAELTRLFPSAAAQIAGLT